jgi:hypothetical protein
MASPNRSDFFIYRRLPVNKNNFLLCALCASSETGGEKTMHSALYHSLVRPVSVLNRQKREMYFYYCKTAHKKE